MIVEEKIEEKITEHIFPYSEAILKKRKMLMVLLVILMPIGMLFTLYTMAGDEFVDMLSNIAPFLIGISVFFVLEVFIVSYIMVKKLRTNKLTVRPDHIFRTGGKHTETLYFTDIRKMKISRHPNGGVEMCKIFTDDKRMYLAGLENMTYIVDLILDYMSDDQVASIDLKDKTWRINWNNPFLAVIYFSLALGVFTLIRKFDNNLGEFISPVINLMMGVYFLGFKPISNFSGKRFKIFEIIMGVLLIGLSIYNMRNIIVYSKLLDSIL